MNQTRREQVSPHLAYAFVINHSLTCEYHDPLSGDSASGLEAGNVLHMGLSSDDSLIL